MAVVVVDGPTLRLQDGIEPMWEDERNKRGGRWLLTLNKQQRRLDLDRFWLETVSRLLALATSFYRDTVQHLWPSHLPHH